MRVILLLIACMCITSCAPAKKGRVSFKSYDVEHFEKLIQDKDVILVDVRTPEEHQAGSIEGTDINLNVRSTTFFADYKQLPKDKTIALYCKSGGRSKQVAGVLAGNGYRVIELNTGYDGWIKLHGKE